jgi:transcription antitermination factor NusG
MYNHMSCEMEDAFVYARWYAVTVRSRQEKTAATGLNALGIPNFLPLTPELRQWSDRKQLVTLPLFPGYLFVRMNPSKDSTLPILKVPGVVGLVRNNTGPLPIPSNEINDIRRVLAERIECSPHPFFLKEGDRARVVRGALAGLEGTLVRSNSETRLVVSVEMIQRSIAVNVSRQDVEPAEEQLRTHRLFGSCIGRHEAGSIEHVKVCTTD